MHRVIQWYGRNWKLTVPGTLVSVVALVFLIFTLMKSCDAYQLALARAQSNQQLQGHLGKPIEAGWWLSGSISVSGPSGRADIALPIHGPLAGATLYVVAHKSAGRWSFEVLEAELEGSPSRIDLLKPIPETQ